MRRGAGLGWAVAVTLRVAGRGSAKQSARPRGRRRSASSPLPLRAARFFDCDGEAATRAAGWACSGGSRARVGVARGFRGSIRARRRAGCQRAAHIYCFQRSVVIR